MKQFLKLIILHVILLSTFSCSVGAGGGSSSPSSSSEVVNAPPSSPATPNVPAPDSSRTPATPNLPPASSLPSVKLLKLDGERFQCGEGFSTYFKNNKVGIKVNFSTDRIFNVAVNFYDSPCSNLEASGNKIANYTVTGDYAVTTASGTVLVTVNSSVMTIYAGDFPSSAKGMVDWMNGCNNLSGNFSSSQNTTLSLAPAPDCKYESQNFSFPVVGNTIEASEAGIKKFLGLNP